MTDKLKRFTDLQSLRLLYDPRGYVDSPKTIQDAFQGRPPEPKLWGLAAIFRVMWGFYVVFGMFLAFVLASSVPGVTLWSVIGLMIAVPVVLSLAAQFVLARDARADYAKAKERFDAYMVDVDLYKDEVFKAAVAQLPEVDFYGQHRPMDQATIGQLEREAIEAFRKVGILQEVSVENRGRPFLIHQYELTELGWVDPECGERRNYTLDLAILWPERRIKYNIEIDGPSHDSPEQKAKDRRRNAVLVERGWFVRRLNHRFLAQGYGPGAIREVVSVIYFFAKYADNKPLEWDDRLVAWLQNRRRRKQYAIEREAYQSRKAEASRVEAEGKVAS